MNSIMYIDDDEDDRQIFCEVIQAINPTLVCHVAKDGLEGLGILRELNRLPDCVFVDLNMPKLSGTEFLIELRRSNRLKNIPVVMYSTAKSERDANLCKKLGVIDFIVKPASLQGLHHELTKVLRSKSLIGN